MTRVERRPREMLWRYLDVALAVVIVVGVLGYIYELMVGQRGLDSEYLVSHFGLFVEGAKLNLYVTNVAFLVGMGVGFLLGWLRTIRRVPLRKVLQDFRAMEEENTPRGTGRSFRLALTVLGSGLRYGARRFGDGYVEVIRGTPLFVQILFVWYILVVNFPELFASPGVVALNAGLIALAVNTGGYQAEIFRAGLQTVHAGQVEAARALGFSRLGAMRYVVLPQALRLIIPPLTNEWIGLFKASTLLFVLGVRGEITFILNAEAFKGNAFEVFAIVTAIFLLITVILAKVVQYLERRYRIPGLGIQQVPSERLRIFGRAKAAARGP